MSKMEHKPVEPNLKRRKSESKESNGESSKRLILTNNKPIEPYINNETCYKKRGGVTNDGFDYETKLLAMVLLRMLHADNIESFYMASNLDGVGNFDDIVLRIKEKGKENIRVQFLQAKHKKRNTSLKMIVCDDSTESKEPFSKDRKKNKNKKMSDDPKILLLSSYFVSFILIREKFDANKEDIIFRAEHEKIEVELIFFTPAEIEYPNGLKGFQVNMDDKLKTSKGKSSAIQFSSVAGQKTCFSSLKEFSKKWHNDNNKTQLSDAQHNKLIEDFFKNLTIYSGQALATEMDSIIIDKIQSLSNKNYTADSKKNGQLTGEDNDALLPQDMTTLFPLDNTNIYTKFLGALQKWWRQECAVEYQTEKSKFFVDAVNRENLTLINSINLNKIGRQFVQFKQNIIQNLIRLSKWQTIIEQIKKEEAFFVNIFSETPLLSCVKVYQICQEIPRECLFLTGTNSEINSIKENISNAECLIIFYLPQPTKKIIESIRKTAKKIIFVTKSEYIHETNSIEDKTESVLDLEEKGLKDFFKKHVNFQGTLTTLEKLMDFTSMPKPSLDTLTLEKLISVKSFDISDNIFSTIQSDSCNYIDRVLFNRELQVDKNISEIDNKTVIVVADPGMGKSTLLTQFALAMKQMYPLKWIVRINLLDHSSQFYSWKNTEKKLDKNDAFDFLTKVSCNVTSQINILEKKLFRYYCEGNKIILLVDGFDEVKPDYSDIAVQLLEIFSENFTDKLWLTTRMNVPTNIVSKLDALIYYLNPFSEAQTQQFLWNVWRKELNLKPEQKTFFYKYFKQLLLHLPKLECNTQAIVSDFSTTLISVPLHAQMIAMICQDHFKEYCEKPNNKLQFQKIDLVTMFDKFINLKFNVILMEEKHRVDITMPIINKQVKKEYEQCLKNHKIAAASSLFNNNDSNLFSKEDKTGVDQLLNDVKNCVEKTGIISRGDKEEFTFVHRSYAEYFAAMFIWEEFCASDIEKFEKFTNKFLDRLIKDDHVQLTNFLLGMAQNIKDDCKEIVFKATSLLDTLLSWLDSSGKKENKVISLLLGVVELSINSNEDCENVVKGIKRDSLKTLFFRASENGYTELNAVSLKEMPDLINDTTQEGWSALHFAAVAGQGEIVTDLIEREHKINEITFDNGQSALHMAVEKGHLDIVEILLRNKADVNISTTGTGVTALHLASENGHTETVELLLKNHANVDKKTIKNGSTALLLASKKGHTAVVELLLAYGADPNIKTDYWGFSPLYWAARNNSIEIVSLLEGKGAGIDTVTYFVGHTAMHIAILYGHTEIVEFLLAKGANNEC
ncbi:uncharacterized protein LOC120428437 [Culex pipiens pallens]|uniref:uncharacterized protein LOC120428437 n=1 Tax=Culex pipiens pallens TaxID=42434 RepID=UPI0019537B1E|nr:uncharacterized protein LOC120428437 [Culex pipiens pallens]XP_039449383.1 uncharacterized protein LOC120428437 [Culex pipiens pallens]